jgi:hypothetical protein
MWWFFMVDCHLNPREHIRLWRSAGKLVGYALDNSRKTLPCQVKAVDKNTCTIVILGHRVIYRSVTSWKGEKENAEDPVVLVVR